MDYKSKEIVARICIAKNLKQMKLYFLLVYAAFYNIDSVGTKFYIILEGAVTVLVRKPNQTEMEAVRTLNKGESFGELALIHK